MKIQNTQKCVHTEHCDAEIGCKYGDMDCPVWLGYKKQSYVHEDSQCIPIIEQAVYLERRAKVYF